MNTDLMFSTGVKNNWETPDDLFLRVEKEFHPEGFNVDVAADESNYKTGIWWGPGSPWREDCLTPDPWTHVVYQGHSNYPKEGVRFWLNPPYGEPEQPCKKVCTKKRCEKRGFHTSVYIPGQVDFVNKAVWETVENGASGVMLLPARTDTGIWHNSIWHQGAHNWHSWVRHIEFIRGRLTFKGAPDPAPFPSMLVTLG